MNQQDITNLINNSSKLIGTRQVLKAIIDNSLQLVVIAKDTDLSIKDNIINSCVINKVNYIECLSRKELGVIANINVDCACIGILKWIISRVAR